MRKVALFISAIFILSNSVLAEVNIITSTSDLAYFAKEIGGELVKVSTIASPKSDIHFVEVRPSYMAKIARADIVFKIGMELDQWVDELIDGSRNSKLSIVDCSKYIEPLEVPSFKADARHGDIHPQGNPHYWIGPQNVEPILKALLEGLVFTDPENADLYQSRMDTLLLQVSEAVKSLQSKVETLKNKNIVYYHNSWPYFNEFTGLIAAGFIEPYPGIPPSPSHVKEIIELVKNLDIKIIAMEPYFDKRVPEKIAETAGAKVVTLYPSIGGRDKSESYRDWLEGNINTLIEGLK